MLDHAEGMVVKHRQELSGHDMRYRHAGNPRRSGAVQVGEQLVGVEQQHGVRPLRDDDADWLMGGVDDGVASVLKRRRGEGPAVIGDAEPALVHRRHNRLAVSPCVVHF